MIPSISEAEARLIGGFLIAAAVLMPLGACKLVEIVIWVIRHLRVVVQ